MKTTKDQTNVRPSFSPEEVSRVRWKNVAFKEEDFVRIVLRDIDEYFDHLMASYLVLEREKNPHSDYPKFLADYFNFLYPDESVYEKALNDFFNGYVQPYINKYLIFVTREEIECKLNEVARSIQRPKRSYQDNFTLVSDRYVEKTLTLINQRRTELIGMLPDEVERQYYELNPSEVKQYSPLSFLKEYIEWQYDALRLVWVNEKSSDLPFDGYLSPFLAQKEKETIQAIKIYLRKNRQTQKTIVTMMDELYNVGLNKAIPRQHLNVFWYVLENIKKNNPVVKSCKSTITEYKPFFTDEFLADVISFKFYHELKEEEEPFLLGLTKVQLEDIMYARFTEKLQFSVRCDSGPFYFFLANCRAKGASFTGGQLEKNCLITMNDGLPFTDQNFRTELSRLGIKLNTFKGLSSDVTRRNGLQYEQIQRLFT